MTDSPSNTPSEIEAKLRAVLNESATKDMVRELVRTCLDEHASAAQRHVRTYLWPLVLSWLIAVGGIVYAIEKIPVANGSHGSSGGGDTTAATFPSGDVREAVKSGLFDAYEELLGSRHFLRELSDGMARLGCPQATAPVPVRPTPRTRDEQSGGDELCPVKLATRRSAQP